MLFCQAEWPQQILLQQPQRANHSLVTGFNSSRLLCSCAYCGRCIQILDLNMSHLRRSPEGSQEMMSPPSSSDAQCKGFWMHCFHSHRSKFNAEECQKCASPISISPLLIFLKQTTKQTAHDSWSQPRSKPCRISCAALQPAVPQRSAHKPGQKYVSPGRLVRQTSSVTGILTQA